MAFSPISNNFFPGYPSPSPNLYQPLPAYALNSLPPTMQVFQQVLVNLLQSFSQLAQNWSSLLQPPPPPAVQLPQTPFYKPPNTEYGWPQLRGFKGNHQNSEAPTGYQWNREPWPQKPGVGNSSEPFRYFLSPVGTPGVEMRPVAPGQYLPLLNPSKYPPLPPDTRLSYKVGEKLPSAPQGYQWSGRYPFHTVLTPKGLPDIDLQYSEFGWLASKHHDNPFA